MANTFVLKRSSVAAKIPAAASLAAGELAVNLADRKLYCEDTAGNVFLLSETPTEVLQASEALAEGDLVNVWSNAGTPSARKASASAGYEAHGYVLAAVVAGASATVYFDGRDDKLTGLTAGVQYLSATTPGRCSTTIPTTTGHLVQRVGLAVAATRLYFRAGEAYVA